MTVYILEDFTYCSGLMVCTLFVTHTFTDALSIDFEHGILIQVSGESGSCLYHIYIVCYNDPQGSRILRTTGRKDRVWCL